ncbi:hypothetical protein [Nocardia cyriacigeorgica]|uniref:hypothetical protein n=1 Tax=Nocardia cyriacigeorgica TaxID=135487 RepID=UPI0018935B84|nr:hypothetical protein [Nocardia cyriacigeorgica]MBF6287143.1 hypothetical protein [Nocardia cyriacigeorgica]
MTVDPFAPEAPAKVEPWDEPAKPEPVVRATPVVAAGADGKVTVTLKGGSGFDSPWIVIHAADLQDAFAQFDGGNASVLASLMDKVANAGKYFSSKGPAATAAPRGGSSGGTSNGRPAGATQPPAGFPPLPEGATYKTGVSKSSGKVWHAYDLADGKRQYVNQSKNGEYFLSDPK